MKGLPQPAVGGTNQTNAEVEEAVEEVGAWFELVPACPYPPKESRRHLSRKKTSAIRAWRAVLCFYVMFLRTGELPRGEKSNGNQMFNRAVSGSSQPFDFAFSLFLKGGASVGAASSGGAAVGAQSASR